MGRRIPPLIPISRPRVKEERQMKYQCKSCEYLEECGSTMKPGVFPYCNKAKRLASDSYLVEIQTPDWCPLNQTKYAYAFKAILTLDKREIRPYTGDIPFTVPKIIKVQSIIQLQFQVVDMITFNGFKDIIMEYYNDDEKQSSEVIDIEMSVMDFHYLGEV